MSNPQVVHGAERTAAYEAVRERIHLLLDGEEDWVAAMATVVCELHQAFAHYDWTGFYRAQGEELIVGPYQGTHGCLRIKFGRGVCGAAAATKQTQLVPDVEEFPGHIACSDSTRSEIVVPVLDLQGRVIAVFDVDSNQPDAFGEEDRLALEEIARELGAKYGG